MPKIYKSTRDKKKYMVEYKDKLIHFGDSGMQQYRDSTGEGLYSSLDHGDKARRQSYVARAMGIRNAQGNLTWQDPTSANYYAIRYLW